LTHVVSITASRIRASLPGGVAQQLLDIMEGRDDVHVPPLLAFGLKGNGGEHGGQHGQELLNIEHESAPKNDGT